MTKSEFIRMHPHLTGKELSEEASRCGMRITKQHVSSIRYQDRNKGKYTKRAGSEGEREFRSAVRKIGTERAMAILKGMEP